MDWLTSFKKAIDYMETHMLSDISAKDIAAQGTCRES